jgi:hypothetical protein
MARQGAGVIRHRRAAVSSDYVMITDSRPLLQSTVMTVEGGLYSHIDADMSPRYDPYSYCCSAFVVVLVHRGEVPNLMYFDRITDGSISLMGEPLLTAWDK